MGFSDCSETERWMQGPACQCSTWKLIALCKGRPSDSTTKAFPTFLQVQNKVEKLLWGVPGTHQDLYRGLSSYIKEIHVHMLESHQVWRRRKMSWCDGQGHGHCRHILPRSVSSLWTEASLLLSSPLFPEDVLFSVKDAWEQPNYAQYPWRRVRMLL